MKTLRYGLLFPLLLWALAAIAQPSVEVLELKHRQASDIIEQLITLYPDPGTVFSADGQRLMVKAPAPQMAEIKELVTRLDVAPAQMRITVRRQQTSEGRKQKLTSQTLSTGSSQTEQSIVVQDGETARIESGSIRRVTQATQSGDMIALIAEDTPMTAGFLVQPRALGSSQVELRVVAFNNSAMAHRLQSGDRETAAVVTLRRAETGEWVPLGSHSEESASTRSGLVYSTESLRSGNQNWSVRVDILP